MKKTIRIMAIALMASAALMTACKKEEGQRFILSVQQPAGAKTTIGASHSTLWKSGDVVNINGTDLIVTTTGNVTHIVSENTIQSYDGGKYYAFYGGNATLNSLVLSNATASYNYTMPSTITIATSELQAPMAAVATGNDQSVSINFQNLCMLLDVNVGKTACVITVEEMDRENNGPLYGTYTTNYDGTNWSTTCDMNADHGYTLTVRKATQNDLVSIPLPAGNHKLRISVGSAFVKEMNGSYGFLASHYYDIEMNSKPIIPDPYDGFYFGNGNLCAYKEANWADCHISTSTHYLLEQNQWDTTRFISMQETENGTTGTLIKKTGVIIWIGNEMTNSSIDPGQLNNNSQSVHNAMSPHAYGYLIEHGNATEAAKWWCPTASEWKKAIGGFVNENTDAVTDHSSTGSTQRWAYVKITYRYKDTIQGGTGANAHDVTIGGLMFIPSHDVKAVIASAVNNRTELNWGQVYTYYESNKNRSQRDPNDAWLNTHTGSSYTCGNIPTLTSSEFKIWESVGAVFLPCYGSTWHTGGAGTDNATGHGYYRTSTQCGTGSSYILYLDPAEAPCILQSNGGDHIAVDNGSAAAVRLIYKPTTNTTPSSKGIDTKRWK